MKPTIYDVAVKAGVSIATVSKVINQTGRISEPTRKKIFSIMKEMDYQPSTVASALTGKQTRTVGLMIPDLANPFFAEIARSVEDRGHELGLNVVMCSTDNDPAKEAAYLALLQQKRVDGIILATGLQNEVLVQQLMHKGIPIALVARDMPAFAVNGVMVDDFKGGYVATAHLLALGHRRIAIISEDPRLSSSRQRMHGHRRALAEQGMDYDKSLVKISRFTIEDGKRAARELLSLQRPPSAIFALNDLLAIGAVQAAREMGVSVPCELSVVGFDNTILATIIDPKLTTVAQPIAEMGTAVMDLLVQEVRQESTARQRILLEPRLVVRDSTSARSEKE